jgi:hypothetical protein
MRRSILTIIAAAILCSLNLEIGYSRELQVATAKPRVAEVTVRPDLSIPYSRALRFKLASRKRQYHFGEMISIDLAVMNISANPIFLDDLRYAEFEVQDKSRPEVSLLPYLFVERNVLPEMFSLLGSNTFAVKTVHVLAGCDQHAFKMRNIALADTKDKEVFENDLFVDWGWGCLNASTAGTYTITARLTTNHVLVSPSQPNLKTAVGVIRSEPLTIVIAK